jgi:Carboxypeptidase regulatory-like domain/TonB dependent receptor/TonB-dependent Receptor Plug Domain
MINLNAITRRALALSILFLVGFLLPRTTMAQVDMGSISGTVRDTSGAVLPGVRISLINVDTGITVSTTTGSEGQYTFSPVRIGHYSISAKASGFRAVQQNNITVDVQQRVEVDLSLPVGEATETIVVNAAPPLLQTLDASVGQVIQEKAINDLPLNGRNFTFLAQLSAGVTQGQQDSRGLGATGSFAANGLRPAQNNYLLDGIDNNSNLVDFLNGTGYSVKPPVDAIQEFKVETNNYSAEMGRSAGAVLNATIKSGTNDFHGTAWEFLRNDKLDAANYFENGLKKGEYRQNQFGATFGGPIRRDKTFFFVDYEGTRIRQAIPYVSTVPTELERSSGYTNLSELLTQGGSLTDNLSRSFSLGQVFDPSTTRPVTAGTVDPVTGLTAASTGFVREPFANNALPANRLDQNAINLLKLFPNPNNSGLFNNFASNPVLSNNTDQFDVRVDQNFSSKDSIFGRVTYVDNPEFIPGPFGGIADGGSFAAGNQSVKSVNSALSETHTFSPTLVNEARLGYNHLSSSRDQPNANTSGVPAGFGIQGVPQENSNGGLGSIFLTGLNTLGSNQFLPSIELSTTSQITDNLTKTAGRQTLKMGFQWQRLGFSILQPPSGRGTWSFSGVYTEIPTTTGGNTGLAQMLLIPIKGTVSGAADYVGGADDVTFSNFARTSQKHEYYAGYFEDDIKVLPKLNVNLGLRYEYFGQLIENYGNQSNFLPAATGNSTFLLTQRRCNSSFSPDFLTAAANDHIDVGCSGQPGLGESQKTNFAPRVGFAYQLTPKFVLRGGYGIFYGGFENSVVETYVDFPFQFTLNYPNLVPNAPITFANGSIAILETGLTGISLNSDQVEPGGVSFTGEDYHMKTPNTQGYNLMVQYEITQNDSVQVGYVGNTVHHLGVYLNPNTPREILPPGLNSFAYSPYPDFSSITYTNFAGDSHYNAMQMNYERRFNHGLTTLANFTYANCMTNAVDVLNATAINQFRAPFLPGFGIHPDFGLCDFDVQKVAHFSGGYQLPFGRGRAYLAKDNKLVNAFAGGWNTNWILTLQDGQPGTVPCAITTTSGFGCFALKVRGVNPYAGSHNVNQWLDPAAFASPPVATTIGQTDYSPLGGGPSQFRGPGFHRLDFSLFKEFQLSERFRLEFRSEFFNLTNHPNFSNPGFSGNGVVAAPGSLNYLDSTNFGKITSTRDGQNDQREIQFALKLYY